MISELYGRILDKSIPDSVDALTDTVEVVFKVLDHYQTFTLEGLTPPRVNPVHLCLVLRITNSETLIGWDSHVNVCYLACLLNNIDVNDAMFGLI